MEDPFFVVREEVQRTIEMAIALFCRWCELVSDMQACSKEEYDWTTNELKNCLRSIEWDLEDLDETISIVEKNMKKFKITPNELKERKAFIESTRGSVKEMREQMANPSDKSKITTSLLQEAKIFNTISSKSQNKYSRLEDEADSIDESSYGGAAASQCLQLEIDQQDGDHAGVRERSPQHVLENDEQTVMLDDTATIMDMTDSRLTSLAKKFSRVLHMSKANWKPWTAVCCLLLAVAVIVVLFLVL